MVFERFVMLKMFMAAMGISAFCIATVGAFKPELVYRTIRTKFRVGCNRGVLRGTVLGAFILGCGMSLSSACPGMVLAQVGAGQPNSLYTVLGGLFGCFLYGSFETSVWGKAVRREAGARSEAERSEAERGRAKRGRGGCARLERLIYGGSERVTSGLEGARAKQLFFLGERARRRSCPGGARLRRNRVTG
jgi:hypothetical protein